MPVAWTGSDYGHVSQATAMMVLLQLYMHEGGYCRNKHVGDYLDYFKKAEQVAKDIMDLQYYELQAEFKKTFGVLKTNTTTKSSSLFRVFPFR